MRLARNAGAIALGLAGTVVFAGSCGKKDSVEIVLIDGCLSDKPPPNTCGPQGTDACDCDRAPCSGGSFRQAAAYVEIAVFNGGCPDDDVLMLGDTSKASYRTVVPATASLPEIGDLSKDTYGFAAILRDNDCGVIAMGCTDADLSSIRRINISPRAWSARSNKCASCSDAQPFAHANICAPYGSEADTWRNPNGCAAGLSCVDGKCEGEGGTSEGGTGCDLTVVASGSLPATSTPDSLVTGPAVAATSSGFVILYRQQDPTSGAVQLVGIPLADGGTLGTSSKADLPGCVDKEPADGVGLAFSGSTGLAVAALQDCSGSGAGAAFVPVSGSGSLGALSPLRNPAFSDLTLASGHSLSSRPDVVPEGGSPITGFDFVFRAINQGQSQAQIGIVNGGGFLSGTSPVALFSDPADYGMVATTDKLQAILGRVPSRGADVFQISGNGVQPPPPTDGGSTEGGTEGGTSTPGEFILPDSPSWGAVTASDNRAAAIVPGSGAGLTLQVADATGADLGGGKITGTVFQSGDLVFAHDHLIVLGGSTHTLDLYRVDGATTASSVSATAATKTEYKDTLGKASLGAFDGSRIAMSAARGQVAVVWLSTLALSQGVPTGGWALLSCAE